MSEEEYLLAPPWGSWQIDCGDPFHLFILSDVARVEILRSIFIRIGMMKTIEETPFSAIRFDEVEE
jgi:hypothetical protein